MKTEEDEAFDELAKKQGMWGGGFQAKRAAAADKQEPAQEPVAQWQKKHATETEGKWENTDEFDAKWWRDCSKGWEIRTLQTTPQQRPWVGLTDEETQAYWDWEDWQTGAGRSTIFEMVRDIEAKLKEKNA